MSAPAPGRPRDAGKAEAILDAGWRLFLSQGIGATSIEAIARAAGVSKVTLYSHYPDKQALFEAAIRREMRRIEDAQRLDEKNAAETPIKTRLHRFGLGIIGFLTSSPAVDFYAVIAGELRRHPALAKAFYDLGPGRTRANLAGLLKEASQRGELAPLEPLAAADQLMGLWQGFMAYQISLGIDIDGLRADLDARVERGVAAFLKLYGV